MPSITINHDVLDKLFQLNSFEIPSGVEMVLVGIRGAVPAEINDHDFKTSHSLVLRDVDHKNLRCSFVQWHPGRRLLAVFPGSTVPSIKNILGYQARPRRNSNCLTPGFYKHYVRGKHRPSNARNWHDGLRQNGQPLAIRRTFDNPYYDNFDTIEVSTGCDDNMHAAWTLDPDGNYFSSAGCQVIMGIPFCESTRARQDDNRGPWSVFKNNVYGLSQNIFPYALFQSSEVARLIGNTGRTMSMRLKFGSTGDLVKRVQSALLSMNFMSGPADGDFGKGTFEAIKRFQKENFGLAAVDCIIGPVTSESLGITMPEIAV